ncbi:hypothetical protein [Pelagicoccus mobilis]|uniref:Uncharacterized protein n=1 Tax=Pelagicoccus mobilis TaxID=415221 RepID=A0A934S529_9BACT|nr:hypothetical protein [Pelagicoccus mobilis]MBK1879927.1 hypothetical protein [Pelagicoccus mobilis]
MNTKNLILAAVAAVSLVFVGCGHKHDHDDHDHGSHADHSDSHEKKVPGPNGGRLITSVEPAAEFLLLEDNRAQLTFVDEALKPVAVAGQSATAVAGDRMNPTPVTFESNGTALVSVNPLPDIPGQPFVLTLLASADAKPTVEKFNLKTYTCGGCDLQEYACTCGH